MHLEWKISTKWVENNVRKGEIACTSNFSFSYNVFRSYRSLVRQNAALCSNGLMHLRNVSTHVSLCSLYWLTWAETSLSLIFLHVKGPFYVITWLFDKMDFMDQ